MKYPYMRHEGSIYRDSKDPTTKEVIILAMGPTRRLCPFDCETWGLNNGYRQIMHMRGRLDKHFLSHVQCYYTDDNTPIYDWNEINKLSDAGVEVFNIHKVKGLKSKLYPLKAISEKFGTEYFGNTICYQLAYALYKGYNKIRIYGADMMTEDEYKLEKGGVEYFIGRAVGMGVDFWITEDSSICKTHTGKPYGIKHYNLTEIDPLNLLKRNTKISIKTAKILDARLACDTSITESDISDLQNKFDEQIEKAQHLEEIPKERLLELTKEPPPKGSWMERVEHGKYADLELPPDALTIDDGIKLIVTPKSSSTELQSIKGVSDVIKWTQTIGGKDDKK